jgi:hypothetical protein
MVQTTVTCDRCGCEITHDRTALDVRSGPLLASRHCRREAGQPSIDLCVECAAELLAWLNRPAAVSGVAVRGPRET